VSSRLALSSLALCLLLATPAGAADPASGAQKVGNFVPFDLAVCFEQAATVEQPVTDVTLQAVWILARPLVRECLVDSRLYGKSAAFKITLTVTDAGFTRTIDSDGLTAFGKKCIDDAVGRVAPSISPLPAGHKPVTFSDALPDWPASEQVRFGTNEFSDVTGTLRLAMPSLCSCFEPFKAGPDPAPITLKLQLTPMPEKFKEADGGMPKKVEVVVADGPPAAVKSCITDKLLVLTYPPFRADHQVTVPYSFDLLNSFATSTDVAALPDTTKYAQLEVMGVPRGGHSQLELARLNAASIQYNGLVTSYQTLSKTDPKKAKGMLKELVTSCKGLLSEHDAYIAALESETQLRQDQLAVVTALKAKDSAWSDIQANAQKLTTESQGLVTKAKDGRAATEKICPKVHL
jgi:hypothetical protein